MAIDVTTPAGLNNLSRLAGSDEIREDLESIFSQAGSNKAIYQQFQTVFDRIAPAASFDKLSINRQSILTARAVSEFQKQKAFDERLEASLAGLSPALQDELIKKLGALGDYKITAQQRGRLLTQSDRQKAKNRRNIIETNANTAKIGKLTAKGTLANIWDTMIGRTVFAPLNRHVLQPITSGHETRMKQAGPFMKMLFWAGISVLGVAAVVATGGLVLAGSLPALAGLGVAGLATAAAVNKARHAGTDFLDARADALVAQDERAKAFRAQNDAYQNGSAEASQSLEKNSIVATLSGVRESDFAGSGATLNVRSGQVVLSPTMHNLYHGRVDVAFERSGNLKIAITDPTMSDQEIKYAIADVYADCTNGKAPESIMVRAGTTTFSTYKTTDDLLNTTDSFTRAAQEARLAAEQKALKNSLSEALKNLNGEKLDEILIRAYTEGANTDSKLLEITASVLASDSGLDSSRITQVLNENKTLGNSVVENLNQRVRDNFNINANVAPTTWSCNQVASAFSGKQDATKSEILVSLAKSSEDLSPNSVAMVAAMVSVGMNPQDIDKFKAAVDEINTKIISGSNFSLTENTLSVITTLQSRNSYKDLNAVIGAIYQGNSSLPSEEQSSTPSEEQIFVNTWAQREETARSA